MSSVMRRMKDITMATLNDRLERSEDPVKLIDQFQHQQKEEIRQLERLYGQMVNHAASLRSQFTAAEQLMKKREEQALLAIKAEEESVAKLALQEKVVQEEKMGQYKALYEESKHSIMEVEEQLSSLRAEYQEVLSKRHYYAARFESIRLQRQMNERLKSQHHIGHAFNRLEDRVSDMELENKCMREVRKVGQELAQAGAAVQMTIERELEVLKQKLEREGWIRR